MKIEYQTRKLDNTCDNKSPKSISVAGLGFFEKKESVFLKLYFGCYIAQNKCLRPLIY
jgi:hypothetical protein